MAAFIILYLVFAGAARVPGLILRYFSGMVTVPELCVNENLCLSAVWEDGGWGDPSDRAAERLRSKFTICHGPVIRGLKIHTKIT